MSLKTVFFIIALLYLLSPVDLIPDRLGWISRIDDLAVIIFLWWKYRSVMASRASATNQKRQSSDSAQDPKLTKSPYEILEISPHASAEEIERAYKRLMAQYHPDKVNHLGVDLQKLAHEKTLAISKAYQTLSSRSS